MKNSCVWFFFLAVVVSVTLAAGTARAQDRFEVGAQIAVHHLPELGESPFGFGFRASYLAYTPFISVDAEVNRFPTNSTGNFGETQGLFGLKAGLTVHRWGVFAKVRPGFANIGGGGAPQRLSGGSTFFALDLGGIAEYRVVRHVKLRLDIGDLMTHFGSAALSAGPGTPIGSALGTHGNFQIEIGALASF